MDFHIEPTSKCTLECPLCSRTWFIKKFKKKLLHEVDVDALVNFIGKGKELLLCGNHGDPIYHSKFIEMCRKFKNNACKLTIVTNGSSKPTTWWEELNSVLDENDCVVFSIDGLEDTNHVYRINAKWKSIMNGIKVLQKRRCKMKWKFIVFKHNQHQIRDAENLSQELGFDQFYVHHSDRWLGRKDLMPDTKFVNEDYKQSEEILNNPEFTTSMSPKCINNDTPSQQLYIDAEGDFYPCCWMGTYHYKYKSVFSPKDRKFNIANTRLQDILQDSSIKEFFQSTKQFTSAHECCKIKCGVKNG